MSELYDEGVRGIRVYAVGDVDAGAWCDSDGHEEMWKAGADLGMAICPLIGVDGLPALARRCEQFADTPVVIDHLARIGTTGAIADSDVDSLCALARFEQVHVKVSAFYALSPAGAPYHDLVEPIRRVVDAFGPERLMWASDAPYQVQSPHEYGPSVALMQEGCDFLGDAGIDAILRGTAERLFFG